MKKTLIEIPKKFFHYTLTNSYVSFYAFYTFKLYIVVIATKVSMQWTQSYGSNIIYPNIYGIVSYM